MADTGELQQERNPPVIFDQAHEDLHKKSDTLHKPPWLTKSPESSERMMDNSHGIVRFIIE